MYIGLDIGGTKIAAGIVSKEGKILKKTEVFTEAHKGIDAVIRNAANALEELGPQNIEGIGVGFAGQIDRNTGTVIYSPNMPTFNNVALIPRIKSALCKDDVCAINVNIVIDNDANAFALAEHRVGKGKGTKNLVAVTLGTGVGGGLIINGELYHGKGYASELGHMFVEVDGRESTAHLKGDLEAYCSGLSIQRIYYEKTGENKKAFDIEEAALKNNNSPEYYTYVKAGKYLGYGLANIVNIFDPDMIVLGGGLGRSKLLVDIARDVCYKNTFFQDRITPIEQSELSNEAAIIGTAMLAM